MTEYTCGQMPNKTATATDCVTCNKFKQFPDDPKTAPMFVNRDGLPMHLAGLYRNAQAFLVLGGPSIKIMPLELLSKRGILIMSANNCPGVLPEGIRPHIWIHTDPTGKFHDSIWNDPSILKFTPVREWKSTWSDSPKGKKKGIRRKTNGTFIGTGKSGRDMPTVVGYERNTDYEPSRFLTEATINRGNCLEAATGQDKKGRKKGSGNNRPHTINTLFAAIRLAHVLGIRTLYLLGADFHMGHDMPYSFGQGKSEGGVGSNNSAYANMNIMLDELAPVLDDAGMKIYNCTPGSHLWSFDAMDFEEAIAKATNGFQQTMDCVGWYDD